MSKGSRVFAVLLSFGVGIGLILFAIFGYLRSSPAVVTAVPSSTQPNTVNVTMQVDGAVGVGPHPTWVGYFVRNSAGQYVQTTLIKVPERTYVHMTVYEYDSGSALRNPVWSQVAGTVGDSITLNGKTTSLVDGSQGNGIAHTFVVPDLNVTVPFYGVNGDAKNFCNAGPCTLSEAHNTVSFTFYSGTTTNNYRWQCFVPCGLGYLNGNGGPMSSLGYMGGFIEVVK